MLYHLKLMTACYLKNDENSANLIDKYNHYFSRISCTIKSVYDRIMYFNVVEADSIKELTNVHGRPLYKCLSVAI